MASYLLGLEFERLRFPACDRLLRDLKFVLLNLNGSGTACLRLSFIKLAFGAPQSAIEGVFYEGEHVDSHPELKNDLELFRILLNVSTAPRYFRYREAETRDLRACGIEVGRSSFKKLVLPGDIPAHITEIAGRSHDSISGLCFWASIVPHVGVNTSDGHFLVSYEAVRQFPPSQGPGENSCSIA